jgi:hypothetical protein
LFESGSNKGNKERKTYGLTLLEAYEQVQKDAQLLQEERGHLLGIEENLCNRIKLEIEAKKRKNHKLKLAIEQQKTNCINLAKVLNAYILADYSMNVS